MEFFLITLTGWIAITIALSMAILAGTMFILGRERVHYVWGVFCTAVALWAGAFYMVTLADNPEMAKFWWKIAYIGIILNPFTFFHFVLEFINNASINRFKVLLITILYAIALIFLYLDITTNLIINEVTFLFNELYYNTPPAPLHFYFTAIFLTLWILAFSLVIWEYRKSKEKLFRQRAIYFLVATLIGFVGGSMNFLAVYKIQMHPFTNLGVSLGAGLITYSILYLRLFNVRVVVAQLLTLILVGLTLFRLIISTSTQEMLLNAALLTFTLFIGVYLILSVKKEVIQREQLAIANRELGRLNEEKTSFLNFASHELRYSPTVIRNYSSLLLEGSYGELAQKVRDTIQTIFNLAQGDLKLVDDYLNVTRIEQGKIKYDFKPVNITKMLNTVIDNFAEIAKQTNTHTEKAFNAEKEIIITLDESKIGEVLNNLVDNAVEKYAKGTTVSVSLEPAVDGSKVLIKLSDTGIGMSKETIAKLFQRFSRARNVERDSKGIKGSGLGLYLARQYVLAHGGRIWAESAGEGKGSVFFLELPAIPPENTLVAFNEGENKPEEISA
jgi:signal transduction histidine kinase